MVFDFQTVSTSCSERVKQRSSVHVNEDRTFDASYIEYAIFSLFRIDILNFIKIKSVLAKEFHIQPSELEMMPAWEYELFIKEINKSVKEENERNQKEMDKAGYDKIQKMSDPKYFERTQKQSMSKMSDFKMPSMPKL